MVDFVEQHLKLKMIKAFTQVPDNIHVSPTLRDGESEI
jgi:hypothetical protein